MAVISAKTLIDTAVLGQHLPIGEDEIRDLEVAFSLTCCPAGLMGSSLSRLQQN